MQSVRTTLSRAARRSELAWRYGLNFRPTLDYLLDARPLEGERLRILRALDREGVAMSTVGALFGDTGLFDELRADVREIEAARRGELDELRRTAHEPGAIGRKTFQAALLGSEPGLDPASVYARFALHEAVLGIANAYFRSYTRLRAYNVWRTFASDVPPRESQLWHRDREDFEILKVFVYLSDIPEAAGALVYARGTHPKGPYRSHEPESFAESDGVRRSTDEQMARVVPRTAWVSAAGSEGTIVFANTRGYHRGGRARSCERLLYYCHFTSQASLTSVALTGPSRTDAGRDRGVAYALSALGRDRVGAGRLESRDRKL